MDIVTMKCAENQNVIINLDELRNSERLSGAIIFNRLFGFNNPGFNEEKLDLELFKKYNIWERDWYSFINFIRNGRIKYHIAMESIQNEEQRISYQKLFIQELDTQASSGIFLKFGPFPAFDNYVENCINHEKNKKEEDKYLRAENPMSPEDDIYHMYEWASGYCPAKLLREQGYNVTMSFKEGNQCEKYYRKKREMSQN
tara:strand:- start:2540 stop:3139 length:600 start_codon:yes stop_codon:yes gene_type:complete